MTVRTLAGGSEGSTVGGGGDKRRGIFPRRLLSEGLLIILHPMSGPITHPQPSNPAPKAASLGAGAPRRVPVSGCQTGESVVWVCYLCGILKYSDHAPDFMKQPAVPTELPREGV